MFLGGRHSRPIGTPLRGRPIGKTNLPFRGFHGPMTMTRDKTRVLKTLSPETLSPKTLSPKTLSPETLLPETLLPGMNKSKTENEETNEEALK